MTRKRAPLGPSDPTAKRSRRATGEPDALCLLVSTAAGVSVAPIGDRRELVLGRGDDVDVIVADDSVSRRHAKLRVVDGITLEDLGSSNGTFHGDRRLAPHETV